MGFTRAERLCRFVVPRKWAQWINETNEATKYRRVVNVYRFDTPSEETPRWEDLDGDWDDDLDEAGER